MPLLYDTLPVLLFFIVFQWYGIYAATTVGILTSLCQVIATRWWQAKWDGKQLIVCGIVFFCGGMTLYFHNPIFVKLKPTIVFWLFAICLAGSQYISKQPLIQSLFQPALQPKGEGTIPPLVWQRLNSSWAVFFMILGSINLAIACYFSDNLWVNFKFYGVTGSLVLFSIGQGCYLARYLSVSNTVTASEDKQL